MNKKTRTFSFIIVTILIVTILFNGTAFMALAAPTTMPDGGVFDPDYYAATYPDVVTALGNDPNVLYQHYLNFGKAEGRKPYAEVTQSVAPQAQTLPAPTPKLNSLDVEAEFLNAANTPGVLDNVHPIEICLTGGANQTNETKAMVLAASTGIARWIYSTFKDPNSVIISRVWVQKFPATLQAPALQPYWNNCLNNVMQVKTFGPNAVNNMQLFVSVIVNAKNSYGAYTGATRYTGYVNANGSQYYFYPYTSIMTMPAFMSAMGMLMGTEPVYYWDN